MSRREEEVVSDTEDLSSQAAVIWRLLFVLGTTTIDECPEWFQ
jgi:hypothetical protein